MDRKSAFVVVVHGNLTSAHFPQAENTCIKLTCTYGREWKLISGQTQHISAYCTPGSTSIIAVDLPFEACFGSNDPYQWPRYVLTCYTRNRNGHDRINGYGALFLPTTPGQYKLKVRCYMPEPSSLIQSLISMFRGLSAELVNPLMPAYADGRYGLRVSTKGTVEIELNIQTRVSDTSFNFKNMKKVDFTPPSRSQPPPLASNNEDIRSDPEET
ncbi:unnamed protein product [Caenorhabditis auriculariae]|uniref:B9 domain-containing protein 1 n=1 Tax=Caenorhabditis auriculariae TaxID=2777116 RepID=A0A8S1H2W4_9PELO|nr:unnamed protein product [Caenorhabditis auriculariae]